MNSCPLSRWIVIACLSLSLAAAERSQAAPPERSVLPPSVELSEDEQEFDRIVQAFEAALKNCQRFTAEITSRWRSRTGTEESGGTNLFRVISQTGGKLRIEAGSQEAGPAQFLLVSDGRQVTRLHRPASYYSQDPVSNLYKELEGDPLTVELLKKPGIDFLIRPDFRAHLVAQIRSLASQGTEMLDGVATRRFRLALADDRVLDVWFTQADPPMLAQMVNSVAIPIDAERTFQLTTTNRFRWEIGDPLPASEFTVTIPRGMRQVNDLHAAIRQDDVAQLVGKPAPDFELRDLEGRSVRLSAHRGKNPVTLIFWATWCAPSTRDMPALNDFVQLAGQLGVAVYAINLGEPRETVAPFVQARGYRGSVLLDRDTETLHKYRIGSIPVTILIGKDGVVKSYYLGSSPEVRTQIRQAVEALVAGNR